MRENKYCKCCDRHISPMHFTTHTGIAHYQMDKSNAVKVLREFVIATPVWVDALIEPFRNRGCPTCGMNPKRLQEVVEAISVLGADHTNPNH